MIKVENRADEHLIVRSLEVINDIKGGGIDTIKTNVDALQRGISSLSERQKKYWQDMGSDSVITPLEKKTLLKEFNTIEQTHTSIMQVANEKEITWKEDVADYDTAYTLLRNYLYDTLKVFDYMGENTTVPNIDTFNGHYEFYYLKEPLAQKEISAASSEVTANMRRLANLDEPGSDGEVAIYNGSIYNYYTAKQAWIKLSNGEYLGPGEHHPIHKNVGDYYLNVAPYTGLALAVNRKVLLINGGKRLAFRKETGGIIFEYNGLFWDPVQDRNNWRYTVAQNDLLSYGYGLSPNLDGKIEDKIEREIEKIPPSHVPCYLGVLTEWPNQDGTYKDPETSEKLKYYEKDWFTWKGASTTDRKLGHVYIFNAPEWAEADPSKSIYNEQIMSALDDITALLAAGDGYFNTIYARKLFALEAVINELSAQVIELRGAKAAIKSQEYIEKNKGFKIDAVGNADFNGNTHIGGNAEFDGAVIARTLKCAITHGKEFDIWEKSGSAKWEFFYKDEEEGSYFETYVSDYIIETFGEGSILVETDFNFEPTLEWGEDSYYDDWSDTIKVYRGSELLHIIKPVQEEYTTRKIKREIVINIDMFDILKIEFNHYAPHNRPIIPTSNSYKNFSGQIKVSCHEENYLSKKLTDIKNEKRKS